MWWPQGGLDPNNISIVAIDFSQGFEGFICGEQSITKALLEHGKGITIGLEKGNI